MRNCDRREDREPKDSHYPEVHSEMDEYERAAASKANNGRLKKQPYPHIW